jgi:hypothetical protein
MGKKSRSGSGIRDEQPGSYFLELKNHFLGLKYLYSLMRIRDPGWKKVESGIRDINIPDPQHWFLHNLFFPVQVECKKAQPKEVVQAANTAALLGKRVILGNLGMMPSLTMLPQLSPAQPQPLSTPSLQAALQQQLAASLGTV